MNARHPILSLLCLLACLVGQAQEFPLSDFSPARIPQVYDSGWYQLNNSKYEIKVEWKDGAARISRWKYSPEVDYSLPGKGSLMGVNMGEFGGGLYYKPADSLDSVFYVNGKPGPTQQSFFRGLMIPLANPLHQRLKGYSRIANGNVLGIFQYKDSLFYLDGLAHMGVVIGGLYSLVVKSDSFAIARVADLGDCPRAYLADESRLWIVTMQGLLVVENGQVDRILGHVFWNGLYPNSICLDPKGTLYVGLRGGYAKVDEKTWHVLFFKYNKDPG
jgi:hypothetical protein